jgi:hypothetical protein
MRTWAEISARAGRNDMPGLMVQGFMNDKLRGKELAKALANSWTMAEWPSRQMEPEHWTFLFDQVLPDNDNIGHRLDDDGNIVSNDDLPESIVLYRGATEEFAHGLSWTTDFDQAKWFATRLESVVGPGHIYTITMPREAIIAKFDCRNENEYLVAFDSILEDDIEEVQ